MLFDHKSPALWVPVAAEGGERQTHARPMDIATYRLNLRRGQFNEEEEK